MLEGRGLHFGYGRERPVLDGASLTVPPGEIVGLAGRSGAGKSTLGRILAGYVTPHGGTVSADGAPVPSSGWSPVQHVHQASMLSVDPRWRVGRIVEEGWVPDEATREQFGVSRSWYDRFPHEISGGQLQRVALLRVLGPATRYLVLDEVSAMLDPISQADVWSALQERVRGGLGILAISHDAALLQRIAVRRLRLHGGVCLADGQAGAQA